MIRRKQEINDDIINIHKFDLINKLICRFWNVSWGGVGGGGVGGGGGGHTRITEAYMTLSQTPCFWRGFQ